MFNFADVSAKNKEALDLMMKNYATITKGFQAIAVEAADYSKKSFEESIAHMQSLVGLRSVEQVVEAQTAFLKSSYEGYVTEATKLSEMYVELAKDSYKPFEAPILRATTAVPTVAAQAA